MTHLVPPTSVSSSESDKVEQSTKRFLPVLKGSLILCIDSLPSMPISFLISNIDNYSDN